MTILVGNQRGGAKACALHLTSNENDHVEVYELRGFSSNTLMGALNEVYAVSQGTKAKKFLYSLSASPPPNKELSTEFFVDVINRSEKRLGLEGQPRAIVFHEKEGRRHAHCVWSRIDTQNMKAIPISNDWPKLTALTREIFIERGWEMPLGLVDKSLRNPKCYNLAEYQRAKRKGTDPRAVKTAAQDAWAISDTKSAFLAALEERGLKLARGNKGRFVLIDQHYQISALPRALNLKTKIIRGRLGDSEQFPSVEKTKAVIAKEMQGTITRLRDEVQSRVSDRAKVYDRRKRELVKTQRTQRQALKESQSKRITAANKIRQARFRGGLSGLWDRLRGEHKAIQKQNEMEAYESLQRQRKETDNLILRHLRESQQLKIFKMRIKSRAHKVLRELKRDHQQHRSGPELRTQ